MGFSCSLFFRFLMEIRTSIWLTLSQHDSSGHNLITVRLKRLQILNEEMLPISLQKTMLEYSTGTSLFLCSHRSVHFSIVHQITEDTIDSSRHKLMERQSLAVRIRFNLPFFYPRACIGGSVVEFSPATREARVQFPANAISSFYPSVTFLPGSIFVGFLVVNFRILHECGMTSIFFFSRVGSFCWLLICSFERPIQSTISDCSRLRTPLVQQR